LFNTCSLLADWVNEGGENLSPRYGGENGDLLGVGDLVALPVGSDKNRQLVITE
jgi:hypothetical protein